MPTFNFTAPDGKTYSVNGPDGATPEQAFAVLQQQIGGAQAKPQTVYRGSILPLSKDSQGNIHFDSNAGVVGTVKRALGMAEGAATLPGDVYSGRTPIVGPDGHTNPEVIDRAANLAAIASPVNPGVRLGDTLIPSTGSTLVKVKPAVPSAQELKTAASTGYNAARNTGVNVRGDAVANMARGLQGDLEQDGIIAELAPKTFAIIGKIANPPDGAMATVGNLEAIRRSLQRAAGDFNNPTEQLAASRVIKGLDRFLEGLSPKDVVAGAPSAPRGMPALPYGGMVPPKTAEDVATALRNARGNYAAAQRSNSLTGELDRANTGIAERAEARAEASHSGRNLDNTIRQKVASLLEKPKEVSGFSDAELDALHKVVKGGRARNAARYIGNELGGGGGLGQFGTTAFGGSVGAAVGGPVGAAVGAALPLVTGSSAKTIANILAKRSLGKADELVRMNSPLYRELLRKAPVVPDKLSTRAAMARAILMGTLANGNGQGAPTIFFPQFEQ